MVDDFDSRLGPSLIINGEVECSGRLVLEGSMYGTFSGNQLLITKSGQLEGKISADTIECFGRIVGNVVTRSLDLKSCGSHSGTVETSELKVELGAVLDCVLQSGAKLSAKPESSSHAPNSTPEQLSQLADFVTAFSEEERACCFEIPWSERLELYNHLVNLLEKDKVLIKIIGDPGSGKTVFAAKILQELETKYRVVRLDNQVGSVTSLLYDVARDLEIGGIDESAKQPELLSAILGFLAEGRKKGEKVLLIIDDAQEMYPASMERITRLLTGNFGEDAGFLHMILLGTPSTETKMVETIFDYFEDETNCQLYLEPLNIKDTADYLRYCIQKMQLKETSSSISLLPYETIKNIHVASGGNIAKINDFADRAIRLAFNAEATTVTPDFVV